MPTVNNNITIEDNNTTISIKNASTESLAIIEDFEADFGFSLDELPNLDLGLAEYCNQLPKDEEAVLALYLTELCDEQPHWDCETDAYDRFMQIDSLTILKENPAIKFVGFFFAQNVRLQPYFILGKGNIPSELENPIKPPKQALKQYTNNQA